MLSNENNWHSYILQIYRAKINWPYVLTCLTLINAGYFALDIFLAMKERKKRFFLRAKNGGDKKSKCGEGSFSCFAEVAKD